jgi:hypothetical protein
MHFSMNMFNQVIINRIFLIFHRTVIKSHKIQYTESGSKYPSSGSGSKYPATDMGGVEIEALRLRWMIMYMYICFFVYMYIHMNAYMVKVYIYIDIYLCSEINLNYLRMNFFI